MSIPSRSLHKTGCPIVAALARMQPSYDPEEEFQMLIKEEEEYNRRLAASLNQTEMEHGQIAP